MSAAASNKFRELLMKKIADLSLDTIKIILMKKGYVFSPGTHFVYADVSAQELGTANGYTVGGQALANPVFTLDNTAMTCKVKWNNVSWLVAGGNLECDGAIIFDDSIAAPIVDPIVGYINFDGTILTYDGGTMTVANPGVIMG